MASISGRAEDQRGRSSWTRRIYRATLAVVDLYQTAIKPFYNGPASGASNSAAQCQYQPRQGEKNVRGFNPVQRQFRSTYINYCLHQVLIDARKALYQFKSARCLSYILFLCCCTQVIFTCCIMWLLRCTLLRHSIKIHTERISKRKKWTGTGWNE